MSQKSYDGVASLYLIPTPIGNLDDITIRAVKTLEMVDVLLCEDTRETLKLLQHFSLNKRLVSCHEFNESKVKDFVISLLSEGKNIGLVTDQGSPIISDPGFVIVREVILNGGHVISLPGATAFVPALSNSGLSPLPFLFYGFLSAKDSKMKSELELLKRLPYTLIFYESCHRIKRTLSNLLDVFGDRNISISREISKLHEEIYRDKISNLISFCDTMKGEMVLVVEGFKEKTSYHDLSIVDHVCLYCDDYPLKEAIKIVAKERNLPKSFVYQEYHRNK